MFDIILLSIIGWLDDESAAVELFIQHGFQLVRIQPYWLFKTITWYFKVTFKPLDRLYENCYLNLNRDNDNAF